MAIKTIKMSEIPEAARPDNLKVLANVEEDGVQSTYLVDLGFIKESADSANTAASAADAARLAIQGDLDGKADLGADGMLQRGQLDFIAQKQTGFVSSNSNSRFRLDSFASRFSGDSITVAAIITIPEVISTATASIQAFNIRTSTASVSADVLAESGSCRMRVTVNGVSVAQIYSQMPTGRTVLISCSFDKITGEYTTYLCGILATSGIVAPQTYSPNIFYFGGGVLPGGVFHKLVVKDGWADASEHSALWNSGSPFEYVLPREVVGEDKAWKAEFIPERLTAENWVDNVSGIAVPAVSPNDIIMSFKIPSHDVVVDSGVFYTDIAQGVTSKSLSIPKGYFVDRICVENNNPTTLSNIRASLGGNHFLYDQSLTAGQIMVSANVSASGSFTASGQIVYMATTGAVIVTATGNTTDGGMRVKLYCKHI